MRTGMIDPLEGLAIARLKQWAAARQNTRSGKITKYERVGWKQRKATTFDASLVRVIDFENALGMMKAEESTALILRYRDGQGDTEIAKALSCSVRKVGYIIPTARRRLRAILDRRDLL